jgi:hypothetical protein
MSYEPRKIVGKEKALDPLERLRRLNEFVAAITPKDAPRQNPLKDGSWPVRKTVGRPQPR